jgi:hypothetical protein
MNVLIRPSVIATSLLVALTLPLGASLHQALAQDDPAVTAMARQRFTEGVKLFDEKKYELARAAFLQAYALKKHPDVLLNLAQSELLSGHPLDAAQHFRDFVKDAANASHPRRADAEKGLLEARSKIGRIQVTVDLPDADIFLDGKKVGTSPLAEPLDVSVGNHSLEAKKPGRNTAQTIATTEGKIVIVNLRLGEPVSAVAPVPTTSATTSADRPPPPPPKPTRPVPTEDEPLKPPPSTGMGEHRESFTRWASHSPVAYVGAGVSVVGLGLGVGFLLAAHSAQNNVDSITSTIKNKANTDQTLISQGRSGNPCRDPIAVGDGGVSYAKACSNLKDNIDANSHDKTVATIGFVAMGVGLATLVGGYLITADRVGDTAAAPAPRWLVAPAIGPGFSGLAAAGQF